MSSTKSQEQLERVKNLLAQAQAVVETIDCRPQMSLADHLVQTLAANVSNGNLSDAEFRAFVANSLSGMAR